MIHAHRRVGVEQDEIGQLARLDRPQVVETTEEARGVARGDDNRVGRRNPAFDQQLQFAVDRRSRELIGPADDDVLPGGSRRRFSCAIGVITFIQPVRPFSRARARCSVFNRSISSGSTVSR